MDVDEARQLRLLEWSLGILIVPVGLVQNHVADDLPPQGQPKVVLLCMGEPTLRNPARNQTPPKKIRYQNPQCNLMNFFGRESAHGNWHATIIGDDLTFPDQSITSNLRSSITKQGVYRFACALASSPLFDGLLKEGRKWDTSAQRAAKKLPRQPPLIGGKKPILPSEQYRVPPPHCCTKAHTSKFESVLPLFPTLGLQKMPKRKLTLEQAFSPSIFAQPSLAQNTHPTFHGMHLTSPVLRSFLSLITSILFSGSLISPARKWDCSTA